MKERWLQTLWGRQDWNAWPLRTCQGQSIQVLDPGRWNNDQGPDFLHAKLFIEQILWVGSVEVHIHAGDWFRHHHTNDPNYLPVILHVVWMKGPIHPEVPTLELSRFLTIPVLKRTLSFLHDIERLPCHRHMRPVSQDIWLNWRRQLLFIRHQRKRTPGAIEQPTDLRSRLARQMGAWVNREMFENIDASISDELLCMIQDDPNRLMAVYLGQATLLHADPLSIETFQLLTHLYNDIRSTFSLNPPYRQLLWMRIRPQANPVIRLIQLASLIHHRWHDPRKWVRADPRQLQDQLSQLLFPAGVGEEGKRMLSDAVIESILINIWSYQNACNVMELEGHLRLFGFEQNRFTRQFRSLELKDMTAADSQAMLELHHSYCEKGRCRDCKLASVWSQPQAPQSI